MCLDLEMNSSRVSSVYKGSDLVIISFSDNQRSHLLVLQTYGRACKGTFQLILNIFLLGPRKILTVLCSFLYFYF